MKAYIIKQPVYDKNLKHYKKNITIDLWNLKFNFNGKHFKEEDVDDILNKIIFFKNKDLQFFNLIFFYFVSYKLYINQVEIKNFLLKLNLDGIYMIRYYKNKIITIWKKDEYYHIIFFDEKGKILLDKIIWQNLTFLDYFYYDNKNNLFVVYFFNWLRTFSNKNDIYSAVVISFEELNFWCIPLGFVEVDNETYLKILMNPVFTDEGKYYKVDFLDYITSYDIVLLKEKIDFYKEKSLIVYQNEFFIDKLKVEKEQKIDLNPFDL